MTLHLSLKKQSDIQKDMKQAKNAKGLFLSWRALWLAHSLITAIVITVIDGILLQRKFNFFTGGFLSVHHLERPIETIVFIVISLVSDFGLAAPVIMLALWFCALLRFNLKASVISSFAVSAGPVIAVNIFSYRILDYVGDIFDLPLAFEIAGWSLSEMLSIASSHLTVPAVLLTGFASIIVFVIWKVHGYWKIQLPRPYSFIKTSLYSMSILVISFLTTCIAVGSSEKLEYGLRRKPAAKMFAMTGEILSDIDRDGYGLLRKPEDPDLFNARIFPYAVEIPDNGIDENGVAGDFPEEGDAAPEKFSHTEPWQSHPNVILIVLETFRADLLGMDYDGKPVTPVLNRLAEKGVSVKEAFAHIGFTAPSRYHLFTGQLNGRSSDSLIDDFKANGYEVAYFSAQDVSFGGKAYDVGFDRADISYDARVDTHLRYTTFKSPGSIALPYDVMIDKVTDFLSTRGSSQPLFLHINLQDTHFPYYHSHIRPLLNHAALPRSEIGPEKADELWSTYLNTASNVDFAVGEILNSAYRYLADSSPGIIVTADHGESLYDDGFLGHGFVLSDIQTQIPLIVVNLPMHIDQPFGHVQLRSALNNTLRKKFTHITRPALNESSDSYVFQYLGNIRRPSQIAFRHGNGRTTYDFRTGRVQTKSGLWKFPGELTVEEYAGYIELVRLWEKMMIDRHGRR